MVAVVVQFQSPPERLVTVSREEALLLAPGAATRLERELAEREKWLVEQEYAKRVRWNRHWFVRLLPFLKADARREAIDVWDAGGGDTLPNLDNAFELRMLSYYVEKMRKLAYRAQNTSSAELKVEESVSNRMF